ncbi:unnamed protein product [Nesidiocoris tenuis]|uniref:Integrase catalytic domain-containing protein n=1 Tax=Nesidiocoris tenuis TaxID=355587 RepID=A0A6H5G041_9HEMI|nr:unnamed protein product [Nesidiocoris tenuis]
MNFAELKSRTSVRKASPNWMRFGRKVPPENTGKLRQPMLASVIPDRPWSKIGIDILEFKGNPYLVAIDYYSKWVEFDRLKSKTAQEVILWCQKVFARFGYPKEIVSDNNPFGSQQFRSYLAENDILLITSSPHYSQGHALAETGVKIVENILKKCESTNQNPFVLLMHYRNAPIPSLGFSPSQLMLGRWIRDNLTVNDEFLSIKAPNKKKVLEKIRASQESQKKYYDRGAKPLSELNPDDPVLYRYQKKWKMGTTVKKAGTPRSWCIVDGNGNQYRRNRRDLISLKPGVPRLVVKEETPPTPEIRYTLRNRTIMRKSFPSNDGSAE